MRPKITCLMGPTATGKTDLAMALCDRFPFEIVSVDSAMIYRDMNLGTAKPSRFLLEKYPHHLIDIVDPDKAYSVADFCHDVRQCVELIQSKGKRPLLVGGTMMYFHALQQGLSSLPSSDPTVREKVQMMAEEEGWPHLHQRLKDVDPMSADKIHPHDAQRIGRALEVYYLTDTPLSVLKKKSKPIASYQCLNLCLVPNDRGWLHRRIESRFKIMLAEGLMDEVKALIQKWQLTSDMPSMRSVGYRQAMQCLNGEIKVNELTERGTVATRQLAKRQLTWLRQWKGEKKVFDPENIDCLRRITECITKM